MTNYKLTLLQYQASRFLIICYQQMIDGVIIAVCGAGKTEMCFPLISSLITNHKIAFAIPRIDICNEIYSRLINYYESQQVGLHTGSSKLNLDANLLVLTTNQLLKYPNHFDLIIIDEVDAFPFDVDPIFYDGVINSKKSGSIFYLTSTPSQRLTTMNLSTFTIYKRWHNQPLPEPKLIHLRHELKPNHKIKQIIKNRNRSLLIFVSTITRGHNFCHTLNKLKVEYNFTYSTHPKRNQVLEQFRAKPKSILLTTTILERGVTFDDVDVLIIDSDSSFYNKAALVQIAGRARRKLDYQEGQVFFAYTHYTVVIKAARKFIATNNQKI